MVKIFYLTGTGNSLKIAMDLGARLGSHQLIPLPGFSRNNPEAVIEGDAVGFVFPVYFGRPPVFLQEFLRDAEFSRVGYIFAVANGGGFFGRSLKIVERILLKKGAGLDAGFRIEMPGNYPFIDRLHRKPHTRLLSEEQGLTKRIAEVIKTRSTHRLKPGWDLFEALYALVAFDIPYDLSKRHMMDRHFWINDGCRNCGLCMEICPVDNIIQGRWKPAWRHDCINCLACYHICPFSGIELRCEWKMIDLVPRERLMFRYRHPDITQEDLLEQAGKDTS